jgi:iodotyrosine deiodinase
VTRKQREPSSSAAKRPGFVPYAPPRLAEEEMRRRAGAFFAEMNARRSVRHFSPDPVPRDLIELAIRTASTAPSGAHRQPWRFVAVSDPETKRRIRVAAEEEERRSYEGGRMSAEWLEALAPLGTDWRKPFLEVVPWIVGLFIAAVHRMGLATLTHTPSPMRFLSRILHRPDNERPFVLFPVGYPADGAQVPDLVRKPLEEIAVWDPGA